MPRFRSKSPRPTDLRISDGTDSTVRAGAPRRVVRFGLLACLLCAIGFQVSVYANRVTERPTVYAIVGQPLPNIQLTNVDTRRASLLSDDTFGCGYIYFFDVDCPACQKVEERRGRDAPPIRPIAGGEWVKWISFDEEILTVQNFVANRKVKPAIFVIPASEDRKRIGAAAIPLLWRVHNGVVTGVESGASRVAAGNVTRQAHLRCDRDAL